MTQCELIYNSTFLCTKQTAVVHKNSSDGISLLRGTAICRVNPASSATTLAWPCCWAFLYTPGIGVCVGFARCVCLFVCLCSHIDLKNERTDRHQTWWTGSIHSWDGPYKNWDQSNTRLGSYWWIKIIQGLIEGHLNGQREITILTQSLPPTEKVISLWRGVFFLPRRNFLFFKLSQLRIVLILSWWKKNSFMIKECLCNKLSIYYLDFKS